MNLKITGKNNNTPTKHFTPNNMKITDKKDIANHLAKTYLQNSSAKNHSKFSNHQNRKSKNQISKQKH